MTTTKKTFRDAVIDIREEFLAIIYHGFPRHPKTWKTEDIDKAFTSAMYKVSCAYLDRIEKEEKP